MSVWKLSRFLVAKGKSFIKPEPTCRSKYSTNIYEPDYLVSLLPETPLCPTLNIQLTGYDYPILENFQKHIHKVATVLDLDVDESYALPPKKYNVQRFKPASAIVDTEYNLTVYERNLQLCDIPSISLPILLRIIQESTPEGVSVSVHEALQEHDDIRYVPDKELLDLKKELVSMGGPSRLSKTRK